MAHVVSALFAQETTGSSEEARDWIEEHVIGPTPKITGGFGMEPNACEPDAGCPRGCVEYKFVYSFELDEDGFEAAVIELRSQLLDPQEVINFEDEGRR